jgi:hypothetical protein
VGVPEIVPVEFIERPAGRLAIVKVSVPSPPVAVKGVKLAAVPWSSVLMALSVERLIFPATVRLKLPVPVTPLASVAVTV